MQFIPDHWESRSSRSSLISGPCGAGGGGLQLALVLTTGALSLNNLDVNSETLLLRDSRNFSSLGSDASERLRIVVLSFSNKSNSNLAEPYRTVHTAFLWDVAEALS